ncbi:hypothetical protein DAPPUDRAFT_327790 [Daphnia pulex]|uniref:Uncharacterized protein n=1 Tax=Daphnia pulex TaxID=6669 RepID=E9HBT4_DAPPU|nr:hypothetical protein DAPPUDRAFT_327790 [Daphnia pulex]|eukprot:EFX70773.1 hypothetical protein DAPPUDRAFT_327790 [Daphnia pulex]
MVVTLGVTAGVVAAAYVVAKVVPAVALPGVVKVLLNAEGIATASVTYGGLTITLSALELAILGADTRNETDVTHDCWKPILRDTSTNPSNGKTFKQIIEDPRIKEVGWLVNEGQSENLPNIRLVNIRDEQFDIQYLMFPAGVLAMHAVRTDFP